MKPCSPQLLTLLASREFYTADLYTFTLANGGVLRFGGGDRDITWNGNLYPSSGTNAIAPPPPGNLLPQNPAFRFDPTTSGTFHLATIPPIADSMDYTNGNLTVASNSYGAAAITNRAIISPFYAETTLVSASLTQSVGFCNDLYSTGFDQRVGARDNAEGAAFGDHVIFVSVSTLQFVSVPGIGSGGTAIEQINFNWRVSDGDIVGLFLDPTSMKLWVRLNNGIWNDIDNYTSNIGATYTSGGDPLLGTGGIQTFLWDNTTIFPVCILEGGVGGVATVNFGPTFAFPTSAPIPPTPPVILQSNGPYFDRTDTKAVLHQKIGVEVDTLTFDVVPGDATIFGSPFIKAVSDRVFASAEMTLDRVFMPAYGNTAVGAVNVFSGRVGTIVADRGIVNFTCNSWMEMLNQNFPRNIYQPGCRFNLGDVGCTVNVATFAETHTVEASSSKSIIQTTVTNAQIGYFDLGKVTFTSGELNGLSRSIRVCQFGAPGQITLLGPMPSAPQVGDTFTMFPGCDKTTGLNGCTKFNNIANYGGMPFIPVPVVAV